LKDRKLDHAELRTNELIHGKIVGKKARIALQE